MTIELHGDLHEHLAGVSEETKKLKENEDLTLVFLSMGGSIEAIIYFNYLKKKLNAKNHKLIVKVLVAQSAAAFIAIMADEFTVEEGGYMMFHNMRVVGDENITSLTQQYNHMVANKKIDSEIIRIANRNGFLSEEEVQMIENGIEIFITEKELKERLESNKIWRKT